MMDLRDHATEVQKIGLVLIKAHPTYERMESSRVRMDEARELVRDLSSWRSFLCTWVMLPRAPSTETFF